jgi:alpha/beta superfamily hydrolase
MSPYSIRQVVKHKKKSPHYVRIAAAALTLFAVAILIVVGISVIAARSLMGIPPKPLGSYSSTVMPPYSLAGFRSLDGQTGLTGWLFQPDGEPRGTVVMVHSNGANRLQFDADTLTLYDFFTSRGYGVLSFDLRHSGESEGQFCTYGYNEWEDVVAAMDYAWRNSVNDNLLLFGWGSGCAASLLAFDRIPAHGADRAAIMPGDESDKAKQLRALPFDRENILAMMLDGVAASPDAYIRADLSNGLLDRLLRKTTVPTAIRLSSQTSGETRLIPILSRVQIPVLLIGKGGPDAASAAGAEVMTDERLRLHPDSTMLYQPEKTGFLKAFPLNPEDYLTRLGDFFNRYLDR